jgi:hypothetical protein
VTSVGMMKGEMKDPMKKAGTKKNDVEN